MHGYPTRGVILTPYRDHNYRVHGQSFQNSNYMIDQFCWPQFALLLFCVQVLCNVFAVLTSIQCRQSDGDGTLFTHPPTDYSIDAVKISTS